MAALLSLERLSNVPRRPIQSLSWIETSSGVRIKPYSTPALLTSCVRIGYEQIVSNAGRDPAKDPAAELVLDARSQGR